MQREEVFVSVIMPSYNHAEFVDKAIESVLSQTHRNFEFLIADDGSTDKSVEVISQYNDPRIIFTEFKENTGFAASEYIFEHAKGKYILSICSDDMWEPELIEKYIDFLEEHQEYGCCFCVPHAIDENDDVITDDNLDNIFKQDNRTKEEWFRLIYKYGNCICAPSMCIRRNLFEQVGPFRFQYRQIQDYELWMRLLQVTNIYIFQERLMRYRYHAQGKNHNISMVTLESECRGVMELTYVKYDIMENLEKDFFIKAFEDDLVLRPEEEGFCLECEKFLAMLDVPKVPPQSAIFYFFRHYNDQNFRSCMEKHYHITRKMFWDYTGTDFNNIGLAMQNAETIKELTEENRQLKKQLDIVKLKLETLFK